MPIQSTPNAPCTVCGFPVLIGDGAHWFEHPIEQRFAEYLHAQAGTEKPVGGWL